MVTRQIERFLAGQRPDDVYNGEVYAQGVTRGMG